MGRLSAFRLTHLPDRGESTPMDSNVTRSETTPRLWHRALAVTASLALAAAAFVPSASAQLALNVAFLPKAVNNPYFDTAATGAQKAAAELGGSFKQGAVHPGPDHTEGQRNWRFGR